MILTSSCRAHHRLSVKGNLFLNILISARTPESFHNNYLQKEYDTVKTSYVLLIFTKNELREVHNQMYICLGMKAHTNVRSQLTKQNVITCPRKSYLSELLEDGCLGGVEELNRTQWKIQQ